VIHWSSTKRRGGRMPSSNFDILSIVSSNSDGVDNASDFLENVILALRDDDVRENLGEGSLALDAVNSCANFVVARRLQLVLIYAIVREAKVRQRKGESFPSKILIRLCDPLTHLLHNNHDLFSRNERIFTDAMEPIEDAADSYGRLIMQAFTIVADSGLSCPAILNAHQVCDILRSCQVDDDFEDMQEEIFRIYAQSFFAGSSTEGENDNFSLFESSKSIINNFSRDQFDAHIVSVLEESLETLTIELANGFLLKMTVFFSLLMQVGKGRYLDPYIEEKELIGQLVGTSMDLLIETKGKDAESVPGLLCAIVEASPKHGLVIVSKDLIYALRVEGSLIGNPEDVQTYLFRVCDCLERVAIVALEKSIGRSEYLKHWSSVASDVIEILSVMGKGFASSPLFAWEKIGPKLPIKNDQPRISIDNSNISDEITDKIAAKCRQDYKQNGARSDSSQDTEAKESNFDKLESRINAKLASRDSESLLEERAQSTKVGTFEEPGVAIIKIGAMPKRQTSFKSLQPSQSSTLPQDRPVTNDAYNDKINAKLSNMGISATSTETPGRLSSHFDDRISAKISISEMNTSSSKPKSKAHGAEYQNSLSDSFDDRINAKISGGLRSSEQKGGDASSGLPLRSEEQWRPGVSKITFGPIHDKIMTKTQGLPVNGEICKDECELDNIEKRIHAKTKGSISPRHENSEAATQNPDRYQYEIEGNKPLHLSQTQGENENIEFEDRLKRKFAVQNTASLSAPSTNKVEQPPGRDSYLERTNTKLSRSLSNMKNDDLAASSSSMVSASIENRINAKLKESQRKLPHAPHLSEKQHGSEDIIDPAAAKTSEKCVENRMYAKIPTSNEDSQDDKTFGDLIRKKTNDPAENGSHITSEKILTLDARIDKKLQQPELRLAEQSSNANATPFSPFLESDEQSRTVQEENPRRMSVAPMRISPSHELISLLDHEDGSQEGTEVEEKDSANHAYIETFDHESNIAFDNYEVAASATNDDEMKSMSDDENNIAVALAIDDGTLDEVDEALTYDPSAKARIIKQMRTWVLLSLFVAIAAALTIGIILTRKKIEDIDNLKIDPPSPAPTSGVHGLIASLIKSEFGFDKDYGDSNAYGKALDWMTQDPIALDAAEKLAFPTRVATNIQSSLYDRYFFGLFYYEMSGRMWVNCSATIDTLNCSHLNNDLELIEGGSNWLSPLHVCLWAGIICDEEKNIRMLTLNQLGLYGTIPSELSRLKELQVLSLLDNAIYGNIPSEIGSIETMVDIDVHLNDLEGSIPLEFYDLTNLLAFNLGYNKLTGTISPNIANMTILKGLHVHENSLSGAIPTEIGALQSSLGYLTLSSNRFNNTLPDEMRLLSNLKEIFLDKNNFEGELQIPIAEGLVQLPINNNRFNGTLPENLFQLSNLVYLIADNNQFTGNISPDMGNLKKLSLLSLRYNQFSGRIPEELKNLTTLRTLRLHYNLFVGEVPSAVCGLFEQNLTQFYADCKNDLQRGDRYYGTGEPEISCECCTDCCDPGKQGECSKRGQNQIISLSLMNP